MPSSATDNVSKMMVGGRGADQIQDTLLLAVAKQESSAFAAVVGDPIPVLRP
jgi:hypothetical protein